MTTFDKNAIIIGQICNDIEPGKKMLQKLMYLISRKGVELGLNYSIHFFGPYSSKLDNTMHILESYDKLNIDTSGTTHIIRLGDSPIEGELDADDQNKVNFVMEMFSSKSAHELEAITTLDYVATVMLKGSGTDKQIVETVMQIKGSKFSSSCLSDSLSVLKQNSYL